MGLSSAVLAACAATPQQSAPPVAASPIRPQPVDRVDNAAFALVGDLTQGGYARGVAPRGTVALTLDGTAVEFSPTDRRFIIGFNRDAPQRAEIVAQLEDGSHIRGHFAVRQRQYDIQHIPGLPGTSPSSPEYLKRRAAERALIENARMLRSPSEGWQQQWIWPVTGRISGVYGSQRILGGVPRAPHFGVDVAVPTGTSIVSPADGVVALASPPIFSLEGNLLIIDHGMGLNSAYLHLSAVDVKTGDRVKQGQKIGSVGTTGRSTGPHLHWAVNWLDRRLDPMLLAGTMPKK